MAKLTEEAAEAIDKKVDEKIKDFKQAIYVLNTFKWLAGILIAALGVGSYLGMDKWIENKVNLRMRNYDEFINAEQLISKGDYENAHDLIQHAWKALKENGITSSSLSNMYYYDMPNAKTTVLN